jgi:hypothetical protein
MDCTDCKELHNATDIDNVSNDLQGFYRTSRIGSREDYTYFYLSNGVIYVRCGCFYGNLDDFERAVLWKHHRNTYATQYNAEIAKVKVLFNLQDSESAASAVILGESKEEK